MKKLNNKGYLLVEIIVAIVLAMGIAYFLMDLTIKFSYKDEDVYRSITWTNDKNILTNTIMEDIEKYELISVSKSSDNTSVYFKFNDTSIGEDGVKELKISKEDKKITYGDYTKKIDSALTIGDILIDINVDESYTFIEIPMTSLYSDEDYGVKLFIPDGIKYLYDIIASESVMDNVSSEFVTANTGIDFSQISSDTNGKGVYIFSSTASLEYPIYYYRGDVNNNVIFADFCFKIVRTTETGGIKLIYNGVPNDGTCDGAGTNSVITTKFNSDYDALTYVGYMYGTAYEFNSREMNDENEMWYYGKGVEYKDGQYTLIDAVSYSSWEDIYNGGLEEHHYSCLSSDTTCENGQVNYIYFTSLATEEDSQAIWYVTLTDGKMLDEDLLKEIFENNTSDSTIKQTLDNWYYENIYDKGKYGYLEDTVWCNDRSIYSLGGWDPNGGNTSEFLYFSSYDRIFNTHLPKLNCSGNADKFTVSSLSGNGDLDYPIGLLTADEVMLSGATLVENNDYYLKGNEDFWTLSPFGFYTGYAYGEVVLSAGDLDNRNINGNLGGRPAISLIHDVIVESGNGSSEFPYVIAN